MTTLHLIRDSVLNNSKITLALANLASDDVIVFLDDGCYNINQALFIKELQVILPLTQCFAIKEHVLARALPITPIALISYKALIELIFNHDNTITWQ